MIFLKFKHNIIEIIYWILNIYIESKIVCSMYIFLIFKFFQNIMLKTMTKECTIKSSGVSLCIKIKYSNILRYPKVRLSNGTWFHHRDVHFIQSELHVQVRKTCILINIFISGSVTFRALQCKRNTMQGFYVRKKTPSMFSFLFSWNMLLWCLGVLMVLGVSGQRPDGCLRVSSYHLIMFKSMFF